MSKIMVHCYSTDKTIISFAICYMVNPYLNCNRVFRVKVEIFLSLSFSARTMENIKYCLRNNNTCVMALIMFYENNGEIQKICIEC